MKKFIVIFMFMLLITNVCSCKCSSGTSLLSLDQEQGQNQGNATFISAPHTSNSSSAGATSTASATANYGTWLILGKKYVLYVLLTREKIYPCVISKDGTLECTAEGKQKLQTNVNIVLGEMGHDKRQVDFDSKVTYLSHMVGIPVK